MIPFFSIILPTYNRAYCICNAIDSVLKQIYSKYELIIVDDGSTDNTKDILFNRYSEQIKNKTIIYKQLQQHNGVCKARNEALKLAKNDWIAYIDSDNTMLSTFLCVFANAIIKNLQYKNFYAQWYSICKNEKILISNNFSLSRLYNKNFIDLGVYVHHISLINKYGMFDENMKRLVDWDLILRQCIYHTPKHILVPVMEYNNNICNDRITISVDNVNEWINYVHKKYKNYNCVS